MSITINLVNNTLKNTCWKNIKWFKSWFKKNYSDEIFDMIFKRRIIGHSKNNTYPKIFWTCGIFALKRLWINFSSVKNAVIYYQIQITLAFNETAWQDITEYHFITIKFPGDAEWRETSFNLHDSSGSINFNCFSTLTNFTKKTAVWLRLDYTSNIIHLQDFENQYASFKGLFLILQTKSNTNIKRKHLKPCRV